jgi:hypothetical protein
MNDPSIQASQIRQIQATEITKPEQGTDLDPNVSKEIKNTNKSVSQTAPLSEISAARRSFGKARVAHRRKFQAAFLKMGFSARAAKSLGTAVANIQTGTSQIFKSSKKHIIMAAAKSIDSSFGGGMRLPANGDMEVYQSTPLQDKVTKSRSRYKTSKMEARKDKSRTPSTKEMPTQHTAGNASIKKVSSPTSERKAEAKPLPTELAKELKTLNHEKELTDKPIEQLLTQNTGTQVVKDVRRMKLYAKGEPVQQSYPGIPADYQSKEPETLLPSSIKELCHKDPDLEKRAAAALNQGMLVQCFAELSVEYSSMERVVSGGSLTIDGNETNTEWSVNFFQNEKGDLMVTHSRLYALQDPVDEASQKNNQVLRAEITVNVSQPDVPYTMRWCDPKN